MINPKNVKWVFLATIFFISQILFVLHCFSQQQREMDSLVDKLKTAKEDTNKANLLENMSKFWSSNESDKSYDYAKQELELSQRLGYKRGIINATISISDYYLQKNNSSTASDYLNKTIPIINQTADRSALSNYYIHMSSIAIHQFAYLNAMYYSNQALQIAEELEDSELISKIISNRGYIYINIYDYATALTYFVRALKINETGNDKVALSKSYYDIGLTHWFRHWNEEYNFNTIDSGNTTAINYFQLSYKIANEINNRPLMALTLEKTGEVYNDEKEMNKALDYFQRSLTEFKSIGDSFKMSVINRDISLVYREQKQFDKAIQFVSDALLISNKTGNKLEQSYGYVNMAYIYIDEKNYVAAINYLLKGLNSAKKIGQKNLESYACETLAKCYELINDYKSAYNYASQDNVIKDSILNVGETIKKTIEIGTLYTTESNKKEIALLNKDKKIQELEIKKQASLKYSFMAGLVLVCILFLFIYRNYRIRQSLKLQQLRNKIAIDLHDEVGSSLSSIKIFSEIGRRNSIDLNDPKMLTPTFDLIIDYSRDMLESIADIVWAINPMNDNVGKIIIRMRSFACELLGAKNIPFKFNADDSLDELKLSMDERKNLYLIFKEAINNMVKHSEAELAVVLISNTKNELKMLIKDNGKGFDINQPTEGNGVNNMKKRASEIGAEFSIQSEPGNGTIIHFLIKTAA